jgi:uncharacterized Zn finger protein
VAATHYILGEQFDEDPFLLFRLRGRSGEQIIGALRAQRATDPATDTAADALGDGAGDRAGAAAPDAAQKGAGRTLAEQPAAYAALDAPLEQSLDDFWQLGASLDHFPTTMRPPSAPLAVLRRLGRPSFVDQDLEQLLGPLYAEASRRALAMAAHDQETPRELQEEEETDA